MVGTFVLYNCGPLDLFLSSNFMQLSMYYFYFIIFFFGHAAQLVGSQFPDQGLNMGHSSESTES